MGYFPAFVQMENRRVLLVGGGNIAREKLAKLLDFTGDITIIAGDVSSEVESMAKEHSLKVLTRMYREGDIDGFDIVVVATDTVELHRQIYEESRKSRILVNSVDNTQYCDFIFPSYVKQGELIVAFSTSGASPAFARYIRKWFEAVLPSGVDHFLQKMKQMRSELPKGKERMLKFDEAARDFVKKNFPKR
jgi:precorrin-2 dehydrogenase/sirohydrochlorin ferrochelatase